MSFIPFHNQFINFATRSFIEPSSSIGALQTSMIQSNLEWCYHFANSQVIFNSAKGGSNNYLPPQSVVAANVGTWYDLGTVGPFRVNLDKNGNPQPLFICLLTELATNTGTFIGTGSFKAAVKAYGRDGAVSAVETLVCTKRSTPFAGFGLSPPPIWQTLTSSAGFSAITPYTLTGSIFVPYFNTTKPYDLLVRSTQSLNTSDSNSDSSQTICYCFIDFSFRLASETGGGVATAAIKGIYLREVNPYEEY